MDNLNSHTRKALVERFGEKEGGRLWDRFTVHYTPKHAISLFSRQCLGQRRIGDRETLRKRSSILEPPRDPRSSYHPMGLYSEKGPA